MDIEPKNILLINFGQIGDVILSFPAMSAVREKFPDAKITALIGKSTKTIVEMSELFDEIVCVDRSELKNRKIWALKEIRNLVGDVRQRKFDFVIDLHSLYETNLLGFVSGAKHRLFGSRRNRSLDFLSNFRPKPPAMDRSLHVTDYYLQILQPLGIKDARRTFRMPAAENHLETVEEIFRKDKIIGKELIGMHLGAGNASRRWGLEKFAGLAQKIAQENASQVLIFLGPEERHLKPEINAKFSTRVHIYDKLSLPELAAAFSRLKVLVGNDTGPMHVGASVGIPVVIIMHKNAPLEYLPLSENVHAVRNDELDKISVEDAFHAVKKLL